MSKIRGCFKYVRRAFVEILILLFVSPYYIAKIKRAIKKDEYLVNVTELGGEAQLDSRYFSPGWFFGIEVHYSVNICNQIAQEQEIEHISFRLLKTLIEEDLSVSKQNFDELRKMIIKGYAHKEKHLLLMYYPPMDRYVLTDGKHRFIEYEKFDCGSLDVPVKVIFSDEMIPAIINKSGRYCYIAVHNEYVMRNSCIANWKKEFLKFSW